jgi:hypothetical protein
MVLQDYRFNNCLNGTYYLKIQSLFIKIETMNDPLSELEKIFPLYTASRFRNMSLKKRYVNISPHHSTPIKLFVPLHYAKLFR